MYIPVVPVGLLGVLGAPLPFILGVHADVLAVALRDGVVLDKIVCCDLDAGTVDMGAGVERLPPLPEHQRAKLRERLRLCAPAHALRGSPEEWRQVSHATSLTRHWHVTDTSLARH